MAVWYKAAVCFFLNRLFLCQKHYFKREKGRDFTPKSLTVKHSLWSDPKSHEDYVTSCSHPGEKIVMDLVDIPQRVYPIGRLDKDTTGLLLLTNDGRLHHQLSHPSFDHEKEYDVSVAQPITEGALRKLAAGLPLMGTKTRPARVRRISQRRFRIVLQEGRNRQIRRMVRKVGHQVAWLKRIRVGDVRLGQLPVGSWRHLTEKEKQDLLKAI